MLKTIDNPTKNQIETIENWLRLEWKNANEGFLTDLDLIHKSFAEKRLLILVKNDFPIGFFVFLTKNKSACIEIFELIPSERKKGLGKIFVSKCLEYLKSMGIWVVHLFCSPEDSEGYWNNCGFIRYELPNDSKINMFKPLLNTLDHSNEEIDCNYIKLWNCEPFQSKNKDPKWIWNLKFSKEDKPELVNPIIFPIYKDWQIEYNIFGHKMKDKVKYSNLDLGDTFGFMIMTKWKITEHN